MTDSAPIGLIETLFARHQVFLLFNLLAPRFPLSHSSSLMLFNLKCMLEDLVGASNVSPNYEEVPTRLASWLVIFA
jgi:hypothetical protein